MRNRLKRYDNFECVKYCWITICEGMRGYFKMLYLYYLKAFIGSLLWKMLERKYKADRYILMPKKGEVYNFFALLYLDEYIEKYRSQKTVIMTCDDSVKKALPLFSKAANVCLCNFSRIKAECLLQYYALYEFSTKITIVSLTEPYDTCGENLLGIHGVTREDLLCYDIYRLDKSMRKNFPEYNHKDNDINELFALGQEERENGKNGR